MKRKTSHLKFVGLHAHDGIGSPFDGLGEPKEHMEYAWQNGMDALALTNHGTMTSFPFQYFHAKQMNKEGRFFKPIFGMEAYYIDSISEWRRDLEKAKEDKKRKKELEKIQTGIVFEEEDRGKTGRVRGNSHFLLLAQNKVGLYNLFEMVSESNNPKKDYFYRKPRIDFDLLRKYSEGIISTTTCISGVFAKIVWENPELNRYELKELMRPWIHKFLEIFGTERYFGELQWNNIPQQHMLNQCIIDICEEEGMKLISTVDSHYPSPEKWEAREYLKRLAWLSRDKKPEWITKDIPKTVNEIGYELYPKNGDQMFSDYKKYANICGVQYDDDKIKESIENTHWIAHNLIEDVEPNTKVYLPDFALETSSEDKELRDLCLKSLEKINKDNDQIYLDRLDEELKVISGRNFSKYFLLVKKIVERAKQEMFVGTLRGSVGGALVAYLLNITKIDPIKWNLLFSRFLPRYSTSFPDIDLDFSDNDRLKKLIMSEWGENNVVAISNYNKMKVKSLLKDVCKFHEIPFVETNAVTRVMDEEAIPRAKEKNNVGAGMYVPTWDEYVEFSPTLRNFLQTYPFVEKIVPSLLGEVRSIGTHAAGLVIRENVNKHMPLIRKIDKKTKKSFWQTPFSEGQANRHLEPLGFLKFDILGLDALATMEGCIRRILVNRCGYTNPTFQDVQRWYNENLSPDVIDYNDYNVYENVFHKGKFVGIFQFTNAGAQKFCMTIKPTSISDGAIVTSTYRPGPIEGGVLKKLEFNKNNPDEVMYVHAIEKEVLEETYGCLIYQEQVAQLMSKFGNVSLDEGNEFRSLLTKKGLSQDKLDKLSFYKDKFFVGAQEKGLSYEDAEKFYNDMVAFAQYGFCKSHAIGYFFISYQNAFLSHYYEEEWCCSFLDNEPEKNKEEAISSVRSLGYKLVSSSINNSCENWKIMPNKTISQPLSSLKGLGGGAIEEIVLNAPFGSIDELIFGDSIDKRRLNKKVISALALSGALDELIDDRFENDKHFYLSITEPKPKSSKELEKNINEHRGLKPFTKKQKIENILEITGRYPFHLVINSDTLESLEKVDVPAISRLNNPDGVVWFIVKSLNKKKTKNGKDYFLLNVIDSYGVSNVIKCWGVSDRDTVEIHRPIMSKVDFSEKWGFSMRNLRRSINYLD